MEYGLDNLQECFSDLSFNQFERLRLKYYNDLKGSDMGDIQLKLLELYAYGTYLDYLKYKDQIGDLKELEILKLYQLTLMSLSRFNNVVSVELICKEFDIEDKKIIYKILSKLANTELISYYINFAKDEIILKDLKSRNIYKSEPGYDLLLIQESEISNWNKTDYLINTLTRFKEYNISKALNKVEMLS